MSSFEIDLGNGKHIRLTTNDSDAARIFSLSNEEFDAYVNMCREFENTRGRSPQIVDTTCKQEILLALYNFLYGSTPVV